ncbi:unnamed protein product [Lactuca saligna]|uniref:Bulb-type lectin domain-containing protein n=1 Tax=Lactuca saligna TaxID=75948 RepID=A0AA35ZRR2_LACSI|nr:unnamed protein product [Lactuca saligna]
MREPWISGFFFAFFLIFSSIDTQPLYFPTANLPTTWINDESSLRSINFTDGSRIRVILLRTSGLPMFTCGFFCNGTCTSYLFAIIINLFMVVNPQVVPYTNKDSPEVIWSANRDNPVREGAILSLNEAGELVLHDVDGSIVWTTNTNGQSTAGMNLTDKGNLMLFDDHNSMVWQSFDHPTDCLVAGQKLFQGQKLIPSVSLTDWTAQKDLFSLQVTDKGLFAYVESNPPQVYFRKLVNGINPENYVVFLDRSLCFFIFSTRPNYCKSVIDIPPAFPFQFIKLMPDGHLKVFGWDAFEGGAIVADLLTGDLGGCFYPLACGRNGICSGNQECSCPRSSFPGMDSFRAVNDSEPNMGCSQVNPLTCNATQDQHFIELKNVKYFTYTADMEDVDMETCKQACLGKCSCKAAIFEYGSNSSSGNCSLPSELFTMTKLDAHEMRLNSSAFIKVQNRCWEQGTLLDIVDRSSKDMQVNGAEVMEMMKVASWCLQTDFTKRPSMSSVVKVLEGVMNVESNLDYNFLYPRLQKITDEHEKNSKPVLPSILSGPR